MTWTSIVASALVAVVVAPQVRDASQRPVGRATLTGTVVIDEPNGQPLKRALISVTDASGQRQTTTDDRGRFTLTGLVAGNVMLVASKPGFAVTYYGARQPGSTVGRPSAVTNDQPVDVNVRVPRGAVIAGTVTDTTGQPASGVGVRVQRVSLSASGQRQLMSSGAFIPSTDDRGMYRVYGLAAGDYVVWVQPRLPGASPLAAAEVRPTTAAELLWAEQQTRGGARGGAPEAAVAAPAMSQSITYAALYYPSALSAASAGIVSVGVGQERSGIDLRLQFVPAARIDGVVTTAEGQPATGVMITLIPEAEMASLEAQRLMVLMEVGLALGTGSTSTADGRFSITGVEPGSYTVLARTRPAGRAGGPSEAAWAMSDIRVDGRDISGVNLRLAPGQNVSGRIVLEGTAPATPPRFSISTRPTSSRGVGTTLPTVALTSDTFVVGGLIPSPYRLSATLTGWTLKSAMLAGRDVADVPFDMKPGEDISGVILTFTDSPAEVTGVLYDGAGRPSGDLSMVLFSADRSMWFSGSRRIRPAVRPATDGRFTFSGLVTGDYYLAALGDVSPADLNNPQFLEQVIPAAIRLSIAHGERKLQDLKIK